MGFVAKAVFNVLSAPANEKVALVATFSALAKPRVESFYVSMAVSKRVRSCVFSNCPI